ncbi:MAG: immunity 17 family protein [Anaerolineae bacterium]|nr:immunity 17 family protein [Anaerolineae bacterium]
MTLLLMIVIGLFSIVAGILDWDWFMNNWRARFFVNVFGRNGARAFYIGLGIFIIAVALVF